MERFDGGKDPEQRYWEICIQLEFVRLVVWTLWLLNGEGPTPLL
jgi:hypothetical protein